MLSSSAWTRQIGSPPTSTRSIDSLGRSAVAAARCLVMLVNAGCQLLLHGVTDLGHRDPVEHLAEESLDQHALGDRLGNAPALQVEEVFRVHRTDRRAVAAAQDVVVQDLEDGLRSCLRLLR